MPYYPESGDRAYYTNSTSDMKLVGDYSRSSFTEIWGLDIFTYWGLLHDAVVWSCQRTLTGREYLENAWYYEQTEPDREGLRQLSGGGYGE